MHSSVADYATHVGVHMQGRVGSREVHDTGQTDGVQTYDTKGLKRGDESGQ